MSKKKATNVVTEEEGSLAVRGKLFPTGSGQAVYTQLALGDGFPPTIVVRFGTEEDGTTIAEVTAGGFVSVGSINKDLRGVGEILATISEVLIKDTPLEAPEEPTPSE